MDILGCYLFAPFSFAVTYCGHAETHCPSTVFRESTIGMPGISALVRTVPV